MADPIYQYAVTAIRGAQASAMRSGQYLANFMLPEDGYNKLLGTPSDPFMKDMKIFELVDWLNEHCIFDGDHIIGMFRANEILWELEPPDMAVPAKV